MCKNRECPHNDFFGGRRKRIHTNGCDIFPGVSCTQCRDFRP